TRAGSGGRAPVAVVLPDPALRARQLRRPPLVVVADTGLGSHPWFTDPARTTDVVHARGFRLGLGGDVPAISGPPSAPDPLQGRVAPYAGHATFIAGLVRQVCPEARLQVISLFDDAGTMPEGALLEVLVLLLVRQWDV